MDAKLIAPRICVDPAVRFGKPTVAGTRVPIHLVLSQLAADTSYEDLMREYGLERADILAVLDYAAKTVSEELVRAQ